MAIAIREADSAVCRLLVKARFCRRRSLPGSDPLYSEMPFQPAAAACYLLPTSTGEQIRGRDPAR